MHSTAYSADALQPPAGAHTRVWRLALPREGGSLQLLARTPATGIMVLLLSRTCWVQVGMVMAPPAVRGGSECDDVAGLLVELISLAA